MFHLELKHVFWFCTKDQYLIWNNNNRKINRNNTQSVTVNKTGCGFDHHSRKWNIYLNLYFHFFALVSRQSATLSSASQHAMPPGFSGNWERSVLTLGSVFLSWCGRYSVKLIWFDVWFIFLLFTYYIYIYRSVIHTGRSSDNGIFSLTLPSCFALRWVWRLLYAIYS